MAPEVLKRNYGPEIDKLNRELHKIIRSVIDFKERSMALKFLTLQKILLRGCDPDPKQCLTAQEVLNAKRAPTVNLGETVRARLQQFSVMNKFKRRLSERITLERAELGLHKLGHQMPDADVQILMDAADGDGDGTLEYGEFLALSIHLKKMGNDEHLHKAFAYFDQNMRDTLKSRS
ncbi:hypothetical protein HPP92_021224 [Vanilla planifolia]|uniref:EF-hand domain-containing protein n=1 Tax=Vanilla planifolia TaxID=51239 RepID=A0A835UGL6_VANPL|nr:hypothetical protein HPP92_021224 [Vanilla planifolia]